MRKSQYQHLDQRVTVTCSDVWKERVQAYAKAHGLDMADVIRQAVWAWLEERDPHHCAEKDGLPR